MHELSELAAGAPRVLIHDASAGVTCSATRFEQLCDALVTRLQDLDLSPASSIAIACEDPVAVLALYVAGTAAGHHCVVLNTSDSLHAPPTDQIDQCQPHLVMYHDDLYQDENLTGVLSTWQTVARIEELRIGVDRNPHAGQRWSVPIVFSAGTTGFPRVGAWPWQDVEQQLRVILTPGASLLVGPLWDPVALQFALANVTNNQPLLWVNDLRLAVIQALLSTHPVCNLMAPPAWLEQILIDSGTDTRQLRSVCFWGGTLSPAGREKVLSDEQLVAYELYTSVNAPRAVMGSSATWSVKPGAVGIVQQDEVSIVDAASVVTAPLTTGLVRLHSETGNFVTADYGYVDEEGALVVVERREWLIVRGGVHIFASETEAVLVGVDWVADAAVVLDTDEQLIAYVVAEEGVLSATEPEPLLQYRLLEYCRARLSALKCPDLVAFVSELPRQGTGRLQKHRLSAAVSINLPESIRL